MQEVDSRASLDAHVTERQSRTVLSKSNLIIHGMLEYLYHHIPSGGLWGLGLDSSKNLSLSAQSINSLY